MIDNIILLQVVFTQYNIIIKMFILYITLLYAYYGHSTYDTGCRYSAFVIWHNIIVIGLHVRFIM